MNWYRDKLLSENQLRRLDEHRYSCLSTSLLDKKLQIYWNWLTTQIPLWLAPNLITVLGLLVNIVTALNLIWHSPDAKILAPKWACGLCGLGLFIYQSLDAIDGKQARRTSTANPLGELFDHGCDSISTIFVALSTCVAVQLGNYPGWMFFQCFSAVALFYCAHWQTYVSGTLRFGRVDVTEAQYTVIIIMAVSAIFGPEIWSTQIGSMGMELKLVPIGIACIVSTLLAHSNISIIFTGGVGKNGSTVAGTSVLSPAIPLSTVLIPAFIIYQKSSQNIYENHPTLYIMAFGLLAAKITNRLVVAHMTKSEMEYTDWALCGPAMLFLNQYFDTFIDEYYVLWFCLIWVLYDLMCYCYKICMEICAYLHVDLFRIPHQAVGVKPNPSGIQYTEKNGNVQQSRSVSRPSRLRKSKH